MKRVAYLLLLFIIALYACQQNGGTGKISEDADYKKGETFLFKQNDSAYYYFNKVTANSRDSLLIAMAYNNMGTILSDAGDYLASQESLLKSLTFLDESDKRARWCLTANYNELGITSYELLNYDKALEYYDLASKFTDDSSYKQTIVNNKALIYQKKKDYPKAVRLFEDILSKTDHEGLAYARVATNLAKTRWLQDPQYNAAPILLKALQIRLKEDDVAGQNSSFRHLADYYTTTRPDSALHYAGKMYDAARRLNNANDKLEALQKLIRLSPAHAVKNYFSVYQKLSDSVQNARNAARNQFALIRYEAEKHEMENMRLQKANTEKEYQIIGVAFLLVTVSVGFVFWYRKRKQRLDLEAQNAIKENQIRLSKKVHDVVANGLYRIMSELENTDDVDKDDLLDKIEDMYERSRDLSYERGYAKQNFHEAIAELIKSFATGTTKVLVQGNSAELWQNVDGNTRQEAAHVLQELMVNMKKHSKAHNVLVRFAKNDNTVNIVYSDDGIGFSRDFQPGNGLSNTGNRIESIDGTITFDRDTTTGVTIRISFPASLTETRHV